MTPEEFKRAADYHNKEMEAFVYGTKKPQDIENGDGKLIAIVVAIALGAAVGALIASFLIMAKIAR